ncbi:MAG: carboxylating nicotinate-nucleotide diphosphorylase [Flavobacteriales bacterium]
MISSSMKRAIQWALEEDLGSGDCTSESSLPSHLEETGWIIAKEDGVVAGLAVVECVFQQVDESIRCQRLCEEGERVESGQQVMRIEGNARSILIGERVALNFLQRMSGIASRTAQVMQSLDGTKCAVLDTRKTTPGLREFEKLAVRLGGGTNHRMGLYDMILIKDNHVDFAGSMEGALEQVALYLNEENRNLPVVVEVRNAAEAQAAMEARCRWKKPSGEPLVDRLLLDNHSPEEAAKMVEQWGHAIALEASGGITPSNARAYAEAGVDFVSMGWITHSVPSMDFSLKSSHHFNG